MHVGLYRPERLNYVDPQMAPFDGSMALTLEGTLDRPITIAAAGTARSSSMARGTTTCSTSWLRNITSSKA